MELCLPVLRQGATAQSYGTDACSLLRPQSHSRQLSAALMELLGRVVETKKGVLPLHYSGVIIGTPSDNRLAIKPTETRGERGAEFLGRWRRFQ